MLCFRSSGRSVNHSGHLTLFPNSDLQPATCACAQSSTQNQLRLDLYNKLFQVPNVDYKSKRTRFDDNFSKTVQRQCIQLLQSMLCRRRKAKYSSTKEIFCAEKVYATCDFFVSVQERKRMWTCLAAKRSIVSGCAKLAGNGERRTNTDNGKMKKRNLLS